MPFSLPAAMPLGCGRRNTSFACLHGGDPRAGQRVQASAGSVFFSRDSGIFPSAAQQPHFLKTAECPIQGAVGGQEPPVSDVGEMLRKLIPVELVHLMPFELHSGCENRQLEGNERARFSPHAEL